MGSSGFRFMKHFVEGMLVHSGIKRVSVDFIPFHGRFRTLMCLLRDEKRKRLSVFKSTGLSVGC